MSARVQHVMTTRVVAVHQAVSVRDRLTYPEGR